MYKVHRLLSIFDKQNCRLNGDTEGEAVKNVLDSTSAFDLKRLEGLMDLSRYEFLIITPFLLLPN